MGLTIRCVLVLMAFMTASISSAGTELRCVIAGDKLKLIVNRDSVIAVTDRGNFKLIGWDDQKPITANDLHNVKPGKTLFSRYFDASDPDLIEYNFEMESEGLVVWWHSHRRTISEINDYNTRKYSCAPVN